MSNVTFIVMLLLALFIVVMVVHWATSFTKGGMQRWIRSAEVEADEEDRGTAVVPTEPPKGQDVSLWSDLTDRT